MVHDALETIIDDSRPVEAAAPSSPPPPNARHGLGKPKSWLARAFDRFNDVSDKIAWPSISCVS